METRSSRKRAEAKGKRPSAPVRPTKRSRFSVSSVPPRPSRGFLNNNKDIHANKIIDNHPSFILQSEEVSMDLGLHQTSSSASWNEKNPRKDQSKEEEQSSHKGSRSGMDKDKEIDKGKEKELDDDKERHRDRERAAVAAAAAAAADHTDVEGNSSIHHNLASASSALQGLLRKLGAGLDELLPTSSPHQSSKLKRILSGLRAEGEEGRQLESLSQLCELLSIGTEESLSTFSVDSFVPVLVGLLNHEYNPDMMLLAARALTHLCDVLPSSCAAVVHYGAIPSLCARLLTIEYIDLGEQSLQALEKISHEHPTACLRGGALLAVLSYLDFFPTGVQRVAVSTAANICRQLPLDATEFVVEAVPILTNLLQYQDTKIVEHASICLTHIAESFASSSEKLDLLCSHGLIAQAVRLITPCSGVASQTSLSGSTYTGLIRLLSTCASGSASATESLLLLDISSILKDILAGPGLVSNISMAPSSANRPPEQLFEIVNLVNELLPPMPQSMVASSGPLSASKKHLKEIDPAPVSAREKLLCDHPDLLTQFGKNLLPVLLQVYGSSVNPPVRHKCLAATNKLVYFSTPDMLRSLFKELNIASFLAGVSTSKDCSVLITALQIAEMLMIKLPDIFAKIFVKEGVVHTIDNLITAEQGNNLPNASSEKPGDVSLSGTPPAKPRRGTRRRSSGSNGEPLPEDSKAASGSGTVCSPPSSGGGMDASTMKSALRLQVIAAAKHFKDTFFPDDIGSPGIGITESLSKLKSLCLKLNGEAVQSGWKGKSKGKGKVTESAGASEETQASTVAEILIELCRGDGVSTFEFLASGIVGALLSYFSCATHASRESMSETALQELVLNRLKQFIGTAIRPVNGGCNSPAAILVRKLQSALASIERFPVVLSHSPRSGSGNASIMAGLSALAQPFKLRLARAPGDRSLRDYSSNIVLIDPLAPLTSVEEFLWPRVQRLDATQKSSVVNTSEGTGLPGTSCPSALAPSTRPSTRSRGPVSVSSDAGVGASKDLGGMTSASSSKGKGKGKVVPCAGDEPRGPETRNSATRRRAAAVTAAIKQSQVGTRAQVGIEDEDIEVSPIELEEAVTMDEDEFFDEEEVEEHEEVRLVFSEEPSLLCMGERVHDVQVSGDGSVFAGNGASTSSPPSASVVSRIHIGGRTAVTATGLEGVESSASRTSSSFVAAAMAGLVSSASGRGLRASRGRSTLTSSASTPRLTFSLAGRSLNRSFTIFQAIQRQAIAEEEEDERLSGGADYSAGEGKRLWDEVYTITYQRAESSLEKAGAGSSSSCDLSSKTMGTQSNGPCNGAQGQQSSFLASVSQGELPCDLDKSNASYNILLLLRLLEGLNRLAPRLHAQSVSDAFVEGKVRHASEIRMPGPLIAWEEFLSSKLTPKLARQMQDALALCSGGLPAWCCQLTRACPFLFPFETRRQYFYSTAFGLSRALQRLQQQLSADNQAVAANDREVRIGRLQRQKVRVSRNCILDSAAKVMELYSGHKAVLEVEYFGEVGTGLGPTLEFYTLLSRDFQKASLEMWHASSNATMRAAVVSADIDMQDAEFEDSTEIGHEIQPEEEDLVQATLGLFPRPWLPNTETVGGGKNAQVVEHFRLLGRVMGKALQDGRLLDLPLSSAFYKLMLGQELDLYDIRSLDFELGTTLQEMQNLVRRKHFLESNRQSTRDLHFRDAKIEDLCLDFTLPGYPEYPLKPDGQNIAVTLDNLEEYLSLVVDATVKSGIASQMEAFRTGFNQVFQISTLQIFNEEELDFLLCGCREVWVADTLVEHMKFDHGYTAASPPIRNLLEVMGEFTPEQQRAFLRFVTGAPRLPSGGLAVLNPKLTIVRKHPTGTNAAAAVLGSTPPGTSTLGTTLADGDLPSVMTCANYLKLPPYSCKEVMRERLLYAISEGQGSFDLS